MVNYEKIFEPYYEGGWEAYPLETTLITADALNAYDAAIMHIEDYLDTEVDPNDNLAETYSDEDTYEAGDYRIYNGVLYKCLEDIDEAEDFDPTKWESCLITDEMGSGGGGGTTVIANPAGTPTDDLETIQIGETIYDIPGGGGSDVSITPTLSTGTKIADFEIDGVSGELYAPTGGGGTIYSEDEQVIGLWIDGSTLYRKTFDIGNLLNNGTKTVAHGISNLKHVINWSGTCYSTIDTGYCRPIPLSDPMATNTIRLDVGAGNINIKTASDWSAYKAFVTLEYTKTS